MTLKRAHGTEVMGITLACVVTIGVFLAGCTMIPPRHSPAAGLRPLPSSAKILFLSNRDTGDRRKEIYSMDGEGNDISRITSTGYHNCLIGIDRTDRYILVTRATNDTNPPAGLGDEDRKSLWLLDLEDLSEKRLTDLTDNAQGDSFSPDGKWAVFFMTVCGSDQSDLYKVRTDGTDLTPLTQTPEENEADPAWSNSGDKIAFVSFGSNATSFVLRIMDSDGSDPETIFVPHTAVSTPHLPPGAYDPSRSPDDKWIVFEMPVHYSGENGGAGTWHIMKIRVDGTGLTDLSEAGGHGGMAEYLPSFSPGGKHIIFSGRYGPSDPSATKLDVFRMSKDGSDVHRLTDGASYDDFAIWVK